MPLLRYTSLLWLAACWACREPAAPPLKAAYATLYSFRFYQPCGQPVFSGDAGRGYYLVYTLLDSTQITECIGSDGRNNVGAALALRGGRDFLLVLQTSVPASFNLRGMEITDSTLFIRLLQNTGGSSPNIWKIDGKGVKLIRLEADALHYAYLPGPAWNGTAPDPRWAYRRQ